MRARCAGFTLAELLVALAIFALVGIAGARLLDVTVQARLRADEQQARTLALGRTMASFERDIEQALVRPVRAADGSTEPAFWSDGTERVQWTRRGWSNPLQEARTDLQRVRWSVEDGRLLRSYWRVLDHAGESAPQVQVLLEGVAGVRWRFLDHGGTWHGHWPQPSGGPLPRAVEIQIDHARFGTLTRLLLPPAGRSDRLR